MESFYIRRNVNAPMYWKIELSFIIIVAFSFVLGAVSPTLVLAVGVAHNEKCLHLFNVGVLDFSCCSVDPSKDSNDASRYYDCQTCKVNTDPSIDMEIVCEPTTDKPSRVPIRGVIDSNPGGGGTTTNVTDNSILDTDTNVTDNSIAIGTTNVTDNTTTGKTNFTSRAEEIRNDTDPIEPILPPGQRVPLSSNESLLLGDTMTLNENLTTASSAFTGNIGMTNRTNGGVENPNNNPTPPPEVVHLRIKIDSISIWRDHDGNWRGDGEWALFGTVSCCGGAINSNMPTTLYSFNAPGAKEGQIDTPDNRMNDVTGEHRGGWGTIETVHFADVKQDFDVNNTDPRTEINLNFFGVEDNDISAEDLPPIPDIPNTSYDDGARYLENLTRYLNNLGGAERLGNVHNVFTKANNYGTEYGGYHSAASDLIYGNMWYKSEAIEGFCLSDLWGYDCRLIDWPDYPDYIINYRIIDRDGPRCAENGDYDYTTGACRGIIIN